jgi:2-iminoacetate synthase
MNTFKSVFEHYNWDDIQSKIYATTTKQVEQALAKTKRNLDDFLVLISPAAQPYLEHGTRMP